MPDLLLVLWSVITFVFALIELLKLQGSFFPFALGGLGSVIAWAAGFDLTVQVIVFVAVSALAFLLLRPLFLRLAAKNATRHVRGIDLLVGLEGVVIQKVDGPAGKGMVEVDGRAVQALPVDRQQKYNVGDRIVVTAVEDNTLIVKKARKR